jgi:hypothetical protein
MQARHDLLASAGLQVDQPLKTKSGTIAVFFVRAPAFEHLLWGKAPTPAPGALLSKLID